jgi:hypothetical protein
MENLVTFAQTHALEQSQGMTFDSSDFTMHVSSTQALLAIPSHATLEVWIEEEEQSTEIDPDLEDEENGDQREDGVEEEDTFEQYLFGEDDD